MSDDEPDVYVQLFEKDAEILNLQQQLAVYKTQNDYMKKTIDTIIRKKCKRGESTISLNIKVVDCVKHNLELLTLSWIHEQCVKQIKSEEIILSMLVLLLSGKDQNDVPIAILEHKVVVFMGDITYVALNLDEFGTLLLSLIKQHMANMTFTFINRTEIESYDIPIVDVLNGFNEQTTFNICMKKALKRYQSLL
jgi:hypothetical protein